MKILKFFGTWCAPCKLLSKAFDGAKIEHQAIDVDENEELTEKYNIKSVPTVIILNNEGEEVGRFTGSRSKEKLIEELKQYEVQNR